MMPLDYVSALNEAKSIVRSSILWAQFIEHTPLENDIAAWMVEFAQSKTNTPNTQDELLARLVKVYDSMTTEQWRRFEEFCGSRQLSTSLKSFVDYLLSTSAALLAASRKRR